jgi:hypothetical protein
MIDDPFVQKLEHLSRRFSTVELHVLTREGLIDVDFPCANQGTLNERDGFVPQGIVL